MVPARLRVACTFAGIAAATVSDVAAFVPHTHLASPPSTALRAVTMRPAHIAVTKMALSEPEPDARWSEDKDASPHDSRRRYLIKGVAMASVLFAPICRASADDDDDEEEVETPVAQVLTQSPALN